MITLDDEWASDPGPVLTMAEVAMLTREVDKAKPETNRDWIEILARLWPYHSLDTIVSAAERTARRAERPVLVAG